MLTFTVSPGVFAGNASNDLDEILQRAGARVERYTDNVLSVACTETARQQELEPDLRPSKKKSTELVYDFIMVRLKPGKSEIRELRELKLMDAKPVEKDARPPAPDNTAYTTAIMVLLTQAQGNSVFSYAGKDNLEGRETLVINYVPARREPPNVTWKGQMFGLHFQSTGRIWIDPVSYDVLRVDTHLIEPFEFQSPRTTRKGPFVEFGPSHKFKVETWDVTIRFRPVALPGAEQSLLLPESAESVRVIQGSRFPRLRTTHSFTNYRRFTSDIKIDDR